MRTKTATGHGCFAPSNAGKVSKSIPLPQSFFKLCYPRSMFSVDQFNYLLKMNLRNVNKNKLYAVLCIVASAAASIVIIVQLYQWLA
jgi:hypothetical protein